MIKEAYCSFEVAKLLKEKGFDGLCSTAYETITSKHNVEEVAISNWGKLNQIKRPTHQMAMAWLREEHKLFIEISTSIELNGKYHFGYTILDKECNYVRRRYTYSNWNYEDAVEAALKYSLENLIKVMETPEKIYLYPSDRAGEEYEDEWGTFPWGEDCVEYTRTDAFIEKACKYISCHQYEYIDFEDFKTYMKGE